MTCQNDSLSPARGLRLLLAGLAMIAIAGCAANQPPTVASVAPAGPVATCPTDNKPFVESRVGHLAPGGFRFQSNGYDDSVTRTNYRPPREDGVLSEARKARLNAAFLKLPLSARTELCRVTRVFVDDDPGNFATASASGAAGPDAAGWAFWEVSSEEINRYPGAHNQFTPAANQGNGKNTYIGIAGSFVDDGSNSLQGLERRTIVGLFQFGRHPVPKLLPDIAVADDSPELATAAMLLHELGHVVWHTNCFPAPTPACRNFRQTSWTTPINWPRSGIHKLGGDLGNQRTDGGNSTGVSAILRDPSGQALQRFLALNGTGTNWASLIAGLAPDEDFAETYKFRQLALNNINVQINYPETFVGPRRLRVARSSRNAADLGSKGGAFDAVFSGASVAPAPTNSVPY